MCIVRAPVFSASPAPPTVVYCSSHRSRSIIKTQFLPPRPYFGRPRILSRRRVGLLRAAASLCYCRGQQHPSVMSGWEGGTVYARSPPADAAACHLRSSLRRSGVGCTYTGEQQDPPPYRLIITAAAA